MENVEKIRETRVDRKRVTPKHRPAWKVTPSQNRHNKKLHQIHKACASGFHFPHNCIHRFDMFFRNLHKSFCESLLRSQLSFWSCVLTFFSFDFKRWNLGKSDAMIYINDWIVLDFITQTLPRRHLGMPKLSFKWKGSYHTLMIKQ